MSGVLIKISANNVVLYLNGATLDGTPKRNGAFSWGIQSHGYSDITVRNGTIRGFNDGISLTAPLGYVTTTVRPSHSFWWRMSASSRTGPREWRLLAMTV